MYVKSYKRENTYLSYKYIITMIFKHRPELDTLELTNIDELYLQKLLNEFSSFYSKSTLKKIKIVFKSAYSAAIRNHKCQNNPALYLEIPEASEKEIRALTRDEETIVVKAASEDRLGHIAIFLLDTGLRACEIINLKWSDYDPHIKEIYIRKSKSKKGIRIVPLIVEADNIIKSQSHCCDNIFVSTRNSPITKTVLKRLYNRLRKKTGIDMLTNHVYRHSFATRMIEKKADYKALSEILGHSDVDFTINTYTNAETKFLHEQISVLENKPRKMMKLKRIKLHHI